MNSFPSAFEYLPKIDNLPLILAGPILRHTTPSEVTVWLALKEARTLVLEIYATDSGRGANLGKVLLTGKEDTIQLGQHLHLVAITARSPNGQILQPNCIYAYDLYSDRKSILQNSHPSISYFSHQLPTFALPPKKIELLKIVHGSCRKPHGGGRDTLSFLDNMIAEGATNANTRPHQLFLTGDQIYGDDVADSMLWLIQGVNRLLFGWSEELPFLEGTMLADELPPGKRSQIAKIEGGFTAMLHGKSEKAKSHLFSFGEYAAAYLLAWSPVLMPGEFPKGQNLFGDRHKIRQWEQEIDDAQSFIRDLSKVRRALANIPVYTICDDHDVSDDWYLNREWCERVLSKPLGKRVVQNGILAYALFQAWGNTPYHFRAETSGRILIELATQWLANRGKNERLKQECDRYLGIPDLDAVSNLPQLTPDRNVLMLNKSDRAIPWHYTVSSYHHEVVVLDTRTWRGYPAGKDRGLEPPMLLCPTAFQQQLELPLSQSKPEIAATFIVLPTNLVALGIIDRVQQWSLTRDRVFSNDVGDSWNFHEQAFAQLLVTLFEQRKRVIILSGDIHYSCAVKLTHQFSNTSETSVLVQLTSSAIKNSELATRLVHTKLKSLFPEKTKYYLGWNQSLEVTQVAKIPSKSTADWQYKVEWIRRQPAETLPWQLYHRKNDLSRSFWLKLLDFCFGWLWRGRWFQEGLEVIGRNNLNLVKLQCLDSDFMVIQESYWHPSWNKSQTVRSRYEISLGELDNITNGSISIKSSL